MWKRSSFPIRPFQSADTALLQKVSQYQRLHVIMSEKATPFPVIIDFDDVDHPPHKSLSMSRCYRNGIVLEQANSNINLWNSAAV